MKFCFAILQHVSSAEAEKFDTQSCSREL